MIRGSWRSRRSSRTIPRLVPSPRLAPLAAALAATACSTLPGPIGEASCRASTRGECAELSDRTFYYRDTRGLVYYAPSGTFHEASTTTIIEGKWQVDEAGTSVRLAKSHVGPLPARPLATYTDAPSVPGDPGRLSSKGTGFVVERSDGRSFETILREAAAR